MLARLLQQCCAESLTLWASGPIRAATLQLLTHETVNCDQFSETGSLILTTQHGSTTEQVS